jgi:hypothetical protein
VVVDKFGVSTTHNQDTDACIAHSQQLRLGAYRPALAAATS